MFLRPIICSMFCMGPSLRDPPPTRREREAGVRQHRRGERDEQQHRGLHFQLGHSCQPYRYSAAGGHLAAERPVQGAGGHPAGCLQRVLGRHHWAADRTGAGSQSQQRLRHWGRRRTPHSRHRALLHDLGHRLGWLANHIYFKYQ